jgi:hypothetical protein
MRLARKTLQYLVLLVIITHLLGLVKVGSGNNTSLVPSVAVKNCKAVATFYNDFYFLG